jgi:O-antigen/teichoic acid export membrane protein
VCGFLTLFIIGGVYGAETLGVFNQVYAFYIVFSQFAAFGVHLSLVKHLAEYDSDEPLRQVIFSAGMSLSFFLSLFFALLLWLAKPWIGEFYSYQVAYGVGIVSVGIFFFSLNKSLLFSLNGMSFFREFAFYQSMRFLLMLCVLAFLILFKIEERSVPIIFPVAEGVLFLGLLYFCRCNFLFKKSTLPDLMKWGRLHFFFGFKSLGGHILLLMNTRIDVLFLGFFMNDEVVGVYSMAAILAEATCQLPTVFRTVYTPKLVRFLAERNVGELLNLIRKSKLLLWGAMTFISALGYLFVDLILPLLTGKVEYREAALLFVILMIGIIVASGYMPFSLILVNAGYPGMQSLMILMVVLINVVGNSFLVPSYGAVGAAFATSFANICSVALLKIFSKHLLGFRM